MIQESTWNRYLEKYSSLLWKIARQISGDYNITTSLEDNRSDLEVSALESINGYCKKNGITIEEFESDKHIEGKLFDQYTKTVLWNSKNRKGKILSKKMPFRKAMKSLEMESNEGDKCIQIEDNRFGSDIATSSTFIEDLLCNRKDLGSFDKGILSSAMEAIIDDPSVTYSASGHLCMSALQKKLGLNTKESAYLLEKLKTI